eukprot:40854-Prymnesium_polylepis.1
MKRCSKASRTALRRSLSAASGGYDAGRLNLPFVGHATFNKSPPVDPALWQQHLAEQQPDVAVLGVPFDCATQYRSGARFGPRAVRAASTLYSFGHGAVYDHEDDIEYQYGSMVDLGDVDMIHTDTIKSHENVRDAIRMMLRASPKTIPCVLGGDHSITAPVLEAFDEWCDVHGPLHVVQVDARTRRALEPP